MRYFRKYEFGSQSAATTKINLLGLDEEDSPNHSVVRLGNIVTTPATYDDDGNEVDAAVLSDKYHVDVMWDGEPDESWDSQLVWMAGLGVHTFGSSSANAEYIAKAKELHPELFPELSDDEETTP
tara:strand:+ start:1359 stop:1733 length:375 start_codon:yes stop_codon:yes gene_type:complete